jgi:hypothetical protein
MLLAVVVSATVVGVAVLVTAPRDVVRPQAESSTAVPPTVKALAVLRAWDRRRASAWADDDRAALRTLYVNGSRSGRHDVAMLAAYHRRGLRVKTMQRQVLAVRVRATAARLLSLVVTDRLAEARVTVHGRRVALPRSRPATRRIVLRRVGAGWRVAEVYDA